MSLINLNTHMTTREPWDQDGLDKFQIKFQFLKSTTWLLQSGDEEGDDALATIEVECPRITKNFSVYPCCLICDVNRPRMVSTMLSEMGFSEAAKELLAPNISSFAREVAIAVSNGATMRVAIVHVLQTLGEWYDENAAIAAASRESMDAGNGAGRFGAVPASASAIEALEKVRLDVNGNGVDSTSTMPSRCTICLEELPIGSQVTRMPCSHVYHGGCIVKWLETSNLCPLCRYEMPRA
uniref:RING-type domain-containing protein n=1 Tax=Nelumbo nucifera TaxID=4432 RepID=A0A822Z443_NELNU|nr:TPA_asm: hypothetical protein HUJ06_013626 [Nelumbo nucifera]